MKWALSSRRYLKYTCIFLLENIVTTCIHYRVFYFLQAVFPYRIIVLKHDVLLKCIVFVLLDRSRWLQTSNSMDIAI